MERRDFLKTSCNICLLGSIGVLLPKLMACSPAYPVFKTDVVGRKIQIPVSLFETGNVQFVRPKGWYYDIVVQKKGTEQYHAMLLKCTHQDNQLNVAGNNSYQCSLHGSLFDADGKVRKGPAEQPLKRYVTHLQNDQLIIEI